jgi:hypothetical protein
MKIALLEIEEYNPDTEEWHVVEYIEKPKPVPKYYDYEFLAYSKRRRKVVMWRDEIRMKKRSRGVKK